METKKPWQSKTNWVALVMALIAFLPEVNGWVSGNADTFMVIVSGVFAVLRSITSGKITVK